MESKLTRSLSQAVALALAAGGAHAATITVTDNGDGNPTTTCTLRQAIAAARGRAPVGGCTAGTGSDTINFANGISSITLTQDQLLINSNVSIDGGGQTIQQTAANKRVLQINSNAIYTVSISDLTVSGGNGSHRGGGIAIYGSHVALNNVTVSNNQANALAGGVFIQAGQLSLNQSSVSGNSLTAGAGSGGIYAVGNASVTITDATIYGNSVFGAGRVPVAGGLLADNSAVTIANSTIAGNSSASGLSYAAGGVMSISSGSNRALDIYNTTITGNTATASSPNVAAGGVLVHVPTGTLVTTLTNSIVAGNTGGNADIARFNTTNVIAHADLLGASLSTIFAGNGNVFSDAPGLGTLANNGGPTQTMLPQAGSPAIDAGLCFATPPPVAGLDLDQRGTTRPQGANCDIGAVEVLQDTLTVTVTGPGSVSSGNPAPVAQQGSGISGCSGTCSADYLAEGSNTPASVGLNATPQAGYHVTWGGACASAASNPTATVTVNQNPTACTASFTANTTTTSLGSSPNPSTYGQSVDLTATVNAPFTGNATGTVAFCDGGSPTDTTFCQTGTVLCPPGVNLGAPASGNSTAICTTSALNAGSHTITAQYAGDTNNSGSTSSAVVQTIGQATNGFTLNAPADIFVDKGPVTVTATSSSGAPVALTSATPSVCTVSGTGPNFTVDLVAPGTCTLDGTSGGPGTNYALATASANIAVLAEPVPTPALSRWAMLALGGLLGLFGLRRKYRRPD